MLDRSFLQSLMECSPGKTRVMILWLQPYNRVTTDDTAMPPLVISAALIAFKFFFPLPHSFHSPFRSWLATASFSSFFPFAFSSSYFGLEGGGLLLKRVWSGLA